DEALEESFPASDPPAWAAVRSVRDTPDPSDEPKETAMANNLPRSFRFVEDPSFAAGPFSLLQREMNRLLDDVARGSAPVQSGVIPPRVDVRETDKELRISVELPGVAEDDLEVDVDDDLLTIRAEKKEERDVEKADQHLTERIYGIFQRSLRLPFAVDPQTVQAQMDNGVLTLTIPKARSQSRNRRVQIGGRDRSASSAAASNPGGGDGAAAHPS
ncbi:MAG: Hsp20/alpha crystallin family protein, partial [Caulobacteraceae bacterium]